MRKRYQKGGIKQVGPSWVAQWWDNGRRRNRTVGRVLKMTKSEAQAELAEILAPLNKFTEPLAAWEFGDFITKVYLPFYKRKWKKSTSGTNADRVRHHLLDQFEKFRLDSFKRDQLQDFLDQKAESGLSFSVVDHLRWDLSQIFNMAVAEGYLGKNPAKLLFTPREAHRPEKRRMSWEEVRILLAALALRERLICSIAIISGLRPGEIFALQWKHVGADSLHVKQRVYRGEVDSPKTSHSRREAALSGDIRSDLAAWKGVAVDASPEAWVFPSENPKTPLSRDNCWRRNIAPKLKAVGLDWVNFQVMRRTHASLMRELKVDLKVVAEQLGHTLDVNLNVYTDAGLEQRKEAVDRFQAALGTLNGVEMEYIQ